MMLLSPVTYYWLVLFGLAAASLALLLRRQELRHPAAGDIAAKGGPGHMLVGAMAWLALVSIGMSAVIAAGIVVPVVIAVALALAGRLLAVGGRLAPLYRLQPVLVVGALLVALVLLLDLIVLYRGGAHG